jgi:hypothetical protein
MLFLSSSFFDLFSSFLCDLFKFNFL